jgi:hypothetical protein
MIMYCYFEEYPLSPNLELHFGTPSVTRVMQENRVDATEEFTPLPEHRFDAVLHLKMCIIADKFDMKDL